MGGGSIWFTGYGYLQKLFSAIRFYSSLTKQAVCPDLIHVCPITTSK